ncbi:Lipase 1-like protein 1 [Colletotrichum truncatum]|uniref:Lipase 1-like protein 1 n=1 Tax=Colletotrichum truncatum TaxID=5467 RepID=A0ACC3Z942_COLTU|nr:Lipase 1-like protein 1 [Colletotrichum truncatum]KAF6793492.1 Lipase 1-like protein 1 [Colletotrichum truncatum]
MQDKFLETHLPHLGIGLAAFAALATSSYLLLGPTTTVTPSPGKDRRKTVKSPKWTVLPTLSTLGRDELPYPPDILPGARDVATPYGNLRVYEWGPDDGERVLLLHGIGTPGLALEGTAIEFVNRGWRVMTFDFFGRGYSDAPADLPYDSRLYATQILLALASSPLRGWTGNDAFHLLGYSLGGAVAASFASSHPHLIRSLTLVAPGGLVRSAAHVGWRSRLLYNSSVLPEFFRRWVVTRRLTPAGPTKTGDVPEKETVDDGVDVEWDDIRLVGGARIGDVVAWQISNHPGYVRSYMSTIRNAPIYDRGGEEWSVLSEVLEARREGKEPGLRKGRVLFVLGERDEIVVPGETVWDARRVLGEDAVEVLVLKAGHEVGVTRGRDIVGGVIGAWERE